MANLLSDVFASGSPALPEGFRTLAVTPEPFVEPGMTVQARISFTNLRGTPARGVKVRFSSPPGVSIVAGSAGLDGSAPPDSGAPSDEIDIGEVAPGAVRRISISYAVDPIVEAGTPLELQAALVSDDMPLTGSNVVRLTVRSRPELTSGSELNVSADEHPAPGGEIVVTAIVRNWGQSSAHDVVAVLPAPVNTSFVENSARVDGEPFATGNGASTQFSPSDPPVIATRLAPGASVTVSYRALVGTPLDDGTPILATGSVASREIAEFDLAPASLAVHSPVVLDSDLTQFEIQSTEGASAERVIPGQRLTLRLSAHNAGTSVARDVTGTVILAPSLLYAFGSLALDGQPYPDPSSSPIACAFGDLPPGRSAAMTLSVTVASPLPSGRILKADASLRSSHGEARRFERSLTVDSQARFDPERNTLRAVGARTIAPGDAVAYSLTIVNTGTVAANDANLVITHDRGLQDLVVSEAGERRQLTDGTLPLGVLPPHAPRTLTIGARATTPAGDGTELRLSARLTTGDAGDVELGEERHAIRSRARFTPASSRLGRLSESALRYNRPSALVLELRNDGNDTARDVAVALQLPEELEFVGVDELTRESNVIRFGDLAAGEGRRAGIHVRLRRLLSRGAAVSLEGLVRARGTPPFPLASLTLPIEAQPDFVGATFVCEPRETVAPGSHLAYTLSLRNSGDGAASHVTVRVEPAEATQFLGGSMSINGAPLHDDVALALFAAEGGLELRDVAPNTDVILRWLTIVADPLAAGTELRTRAAIAVDGDALETVSTSPVTVGAVPALLSAALKLPFSVGAIATQPRGRLPEIAGATPQAADETRPPDRGDVFSSPSGAAVTPNGDTRSPVVVSPNGAAPASDGAGSTDDVTSAQASPDGFVRASATTAYAASRSTDVRLVLTADWLVRALRFSRDVGNSPGFLRHLFAIRLFFPDGPAAASPALQKAFDAARTALRSNQERLALRLRQPRILLETADLERDDGRAAWRTLFRTLAQAPAATEAVPLTPGTSSLVGSIPSQTATTLADRLAAAPLGSAAPWFALGHLVGTSVVGEGDNGSVGTYRAALLSTLSAFEAMKPSRFQRALVNHSNVALDEMLDRFLRSTALGGSMRASEPAERR